MWVPNYSAFLSTFLSTYGWLIDLHPLPECRTLPSDASWPNSTVFDLFNQSIHGRLIKTVPIGSPCHNPTYDEEKCAYIQTHWHRPELQYVTNRPSFILINQFSMHSSVSSASSVMDSIFLNKSCDPFTDPVEQCIIGAYVQYAVNVSEPEDIVKSLEFVKKHNIRFVVKNTGHESVL